MPFAFVALLLAACSLLGFSSGAMAGLQPDSFETAAVGVVGLGVLVLMLWPGALVRVLYGRRPVSQSSEERSSRAEAGDAA